MQNRFAGVNAVCGLRFSLRFVYHVYTAWSRRPSQLRAQPIFAQLWHGWAVMQQRLTDVGTSFPQLAA